MLFSARNLTRNSRLKKPVLFLVSKGWASELKLSIVVTRHGDRTPLHVFPNSLSTWPEGEGVLTPVGVRQLENLGKQYRESYVDKHKLVSPTFNDSQILVRSTGKQRTLMSAYAFMAGFYPPTGNTTEFGLSYGIQPVPIYSESSKSDMLLYAYKNCPSLKSKRAFEKETPAYQKFVAESEENVAIISDIVGEHLEVSDISSVANILNAERVHNRPTLSAIVDNPTLYSWVKKTGNRVLQQKFPTQEIGWLGTGLLFPDIINRMQYKIRNAPGPNFVFYSTHDGLLLAMTAALKVNIEEIPYASHFAFELYGDEANGYHVITKFNFKEVSILNLDVRAKFADFTRALNDLAQKYPTSMCQTATVKEKITTEL